MSDKDLIQEARRWITLHRDNSYQREAAKRMERLADALEARLSVESLVCEPRQDSMLLWEGTSSASAPANEYGDAEESEAEYKDHAATVTSEPTDAQIEAGLKKVDWDAIRAGEADPEEAAGVAVRAALVAAQCAAPQAENADCDRDHMGICRRCGMGLDAGKVLDGDSACPVLPGGVDEGALAEVRRAAAEKAWDRCVDEMPIDPDWKNFYGDNNPYRAEAYRKEGFGISGT